MKTVSVIGGDLRQITLGRLLRAEGFHLSAWGLDKGPATDLPQADSLKAALSKDIIILPMPVCAGDHINAPFSDKLIDTDLLLSEINPPALVLGGKIPAYFAQALESKGVLCQDYLKREELAVKNAIPVALAV